MKSLVLIAALAIASTQAHAAIMYQEYTCGATHSEGSQHPIPDAPNYGLKCYIAVGGISGKGLNCKLLINSVYPVGQQTETELQTVTFENGVGVLQAEDTKVQVNTKKGTAQIAIGNSLFANCSEVSL